MSSIPENAVWFITGCSSGLGQHLSQVISSHPSYRVVATARKAASLSYLPDSPNIFKLALDVTSPASITSAVRETISKFGRLDVLINNAGYGLMGDTEAISDAQARAQLETNFWGAVNMTKEVLPVFRETNPAGAGGIVVQISSVGGYLGFQGSAFYHASKFALEGFTESLAKEMFPEWNIRFMIFEPGGIQTEFAKGSLQSADRHPAYVDPNGPTSQLQEYLAAPAAQENFALPEVMAKTVVKVVASDDLPLRLPAGSDAWGMIKKDVDDTLKELEKWKAVSQSCSGAELLASINFLNR
ncbi:hypothetical protein B0O99DRAFT_641426 [Bisporella sp. PMI_857]|nr:hypothetical protein B0O99DRAFT_641426 [Bisporella sp. PMI_857]